MASAAGNHAVDHKVDAGIQPEIMRVVELLRAAAPAPTPTAPESALTARASGARDA